MYVNVNVQLAPGETLVGDKQAHDAATEILALFGGDPTTDTCYVTVAQAVSTTVGAAAPEPPTLEADEVE